jgi:hypothetical protein
MKKRERRTVKSDERKREMKVMMNIYRLFASEFLRPTLIAEDSGGSKSFFTKNLLKLKKTSF